MDLNVVIAIPTGGNVTAGTLWSVANTVACFCQATYEGGRKDVEVVEVSGSILPDVRHRLVAEAMHREATHLLWWDSDIVAPFDCIQRLLRHNLPVVACNYPRRAGLPTIPTAYVDGEDYTGPLYTPDDADGLVEVSHAGMGLMLTDMRVYDAVDMPFFCFQHTPGTPRVIGEDVYFCRKLREAGIPVMVDQVLSRGIEHVGEIHYTHTMANASRDAAKTAPPVLRERSDAA
ncbi:hypothetical protein [Azospirillum sp. ST 5-10]|uniref:hypothetical protein n=1 Tax=unclassified Azospirillum TaxID=2630922 RepID=UPI003F49DCE1